MEAVRCGGENCEATKVDTGAGPKTTYGSILCRMTAIRDSNHHLHIFTRRWYLEGGAAAHDTALTVKTCAFRHISTHRRASYGIIHPLIRCSSGS